MPGRVPAWYLALVGASAGVRLLELRHSARNERAALGAARRPAAGHYPRMVALHTALHTVPLLEVAVLRRRARLPWLWVGVLAGSVALRWWSIGSLGTAWNVRGVVPDPLPVVAAGPYRFVRHPNYLAVALEFAALPLAGGAWLSALVLSALDALTLRERVREEERRLFAQPAYRAVFERRKKFVPGVW